MRFAPLLAAFLSIAFPALADPPRVVTDIAPVHALVAQVMEGVGTPDLIVAAAASPHGATLRPSQARALARADLVVWIGPALTPWLEGPVATLAPRAERLTLLTLPATRTLPMRAAFADHDRHDHQGGETDPHAWLDPDNARAWLGAIAETLAARDSANAETYRLNADRARARLQDITARLEALLAPLGDTGFIVFHDAYHYFEDRFGLTAAAAFSPGDAAPPGARRVARIRRIARRKGIGCAFTDPATDPRRITSVVGTGRMHIGTLDAMGSAHPPGPGLYEAMLGDMAAAFLDCAGSGTP